jgi:chromosome segregation ATPase
MEQKGATSNERLIIDEVLKNLEKTAEQIHDLLKDFNDTKIDLATIRTELRYVIENIKDLSIIRTAMTTRLALIEKSIEELREYVSQDTIDDTEMVKKVTTLEEKVMHLSSCIDDIECKKKEKEEEDKKIELAKTSGKWKFYAVLAGGFFTLASSVIAIIVSLL